jgi:hypothetical protein
MNPPKTPLALVLFLYDYHSKLFPNALDGIAEKDAQNRLGTSANHMAWIAGSLVYQRQMLAAAAGVSVKQTLEPFFKAEDGQGFKGIGEDAHYPALSEYLRDWDSVSPALRDGLAKMDEVQLHSPDQWVMPGEDYTLLDALTFCVDRESYCLGQLGLYRRLLGYEAMKWD